MTIDLSDLVSPLLLLLLSAIGFFTRSAWTRIEERLGRLENAQTANTTRLVRIETELGILEAGHDLA